MDFKEEVHSSHRSPEQLILEINKLAGVQNYEFTDTLVKRLKRNRYLPS